MDTEALREFSPPLEWLNLADRYMALPPCERFEIVRDIRRGERCPHGYPDCGEECELCSVWYPPSAALDERGGA